MIKIITEGDSPFDLNPIADAVNAAFPQKYELGVEVNFVEEDEIRALNLENREIDKVTDVLSFPYTDCQKGEEIDISDYLDEVEDGELLIGSVAVCLKRAEEQAKEYGHSLKREVYYLVLHGILHCLGFDHIDKDDEAEMTAVAEKIMTKLNVLRGEN